ncbi:hypothetical protein F9Y90_00280 [Borrelia miyamotoi]|uniref:DUF261 family protein n=1 Tax=Borrelia miyamotoi TaxID=47466 RepID=A0AAX3JLB9_9SPIR|nr:hypothetical protein [Borrelia miyamotoi]QFP41593.1 hypothetical protein F9Y90_00280 [Borrelia miyamotoi]QFP47713.1 hypothetical protein F9Y91_00275 [Borrelia miyamotoi]QGT55474.1 hypothetical protein GNY89_00280 [Borrelia miyamotoi]QGT56255.1 hypothetical protein GNY88_00280 [Borrelia miyamotoi]WAZ71499.1 hypothetical protein O5404_00280 [Borrelia miyamotoi]
MNLNLDEKYFNRVYLKGKAPVCYDNSLLVYRVHYYIYTYVSMIKVNCSDKKYVYTFFVASFCYEVFDSFNYNFDYIGINEFLIANFSRIFLSKNLNLNPIIRKLMALKNSIILKFYDKGVLKAKKVF